MTTLEFAFVHHLSSLDVDSTMHKHLQVLANGTRRKINNCHKIWSNRYCVLAMTRKFVT
jgi:ribose 1,5-bisphosphokinase PhnN